MCIKGLGLRVEWNALCYHAGILNRETRVTGMLRRLDVLMLVMLFMVPQVVHAQDQGEGRGERGVTPQIGGLQPHANFTIMSAPATIAVESTQSVTIRLHNYTATAGSFFIGCADAGQVTCTNAAPGDPVTIAGGGYYNGSIAIHGYGLGSGSVTVTLFNDTGSGALMSDESPSVAARSLGGVPIDDQETLNLSVTGTPLVRHELPENGGLQNGSAPMQATFLQPVKLSSVKVWIGAVQQFDTSLSAVGYTLTPSVDTGTHTWKTDYCNAANTRCESISTTFRQLEPLPTDWELDDSLPTPNGTGQVGLLGGLPLPPDSLRGCPMEPSAPEIRLDQPSSFLSQPASGSYPGGLIFVASVSMNDMVTIKTLTVDRADNDPTTCADYGYLDGSNFNYGWWTGTVPNDTLWTGYPYGDDVALRSPLDGALWPFESPGAAWLPMVTGTLEPTPLWRSRVSSHVLTRRMPAARPLTSRRFIPDPGDIDSLSFKLWLNDSLIVSGFSHPTGVTVDWLKRTGASVSIPASSPLLHAYVLGSPFANYGGWNELAASIADTSG
ncbi:MAG TPA: hypothetical protein VFO96_09710, partial [Gemmatimonadales bacterium]|nr:hypothetical protein [Gemmatimonadales bacterium]